MSVNLYEYYWVLEMRKLEEEEEEEQLMGMGGIF